MILEIAIALQAILIAGMWISTIDVPVESAAEEASRKIKEKTKETIDALAAGIEKNKSEIRKRIANRSDCPLYNDKSDQPPYGTCIALEGECRMQYNLATVKDQEKFEQCSVYQIARKIVPN